MSIRNATAILVALCCGIVVTELTGPPDKASAPLFDTDRVVALVNEMSAGKIVDEEHVMFVARGQQQAAELPAKIGSVPRETGSSADCEECLVRSFVESATAGRDRRAQIRAAIFEIGGGSSSATHYLPEIMKSKPACMWELVSPADIRNAALDRFDVVIFPGGSGKKQGAALDEEGRRAVRKFVREGGGYVGICAGAFLTTTTHDVYLALVNAKTNTRAGAATVEVGTTGPGRETFTGFPDSFDVRFSGGPIFSPAAREDLSDYITLGLYRTEFSKTESQRGTMVGTPAIIAARYGRGRVIAFSFHPEVLEGTQPLVKQAVLSTARDPATRAGGTRGAAHMLLENGGLKRKPLP